jgi:hypothetical protein
MQVRLGLLDEEDAQRYLLGVGLAEVGEQDRHVEEVLIAQAALGQLPRPRLAQAGQELSNECGELGIGEGDVGLLAMPGEGHLIEHALDQLDGAPHLRVLGELLVRPLSDLDETVAVDLNRREGVQQPCKSIGPARL